MTSCIRYRISTGRTRKDTKVNITSLFVFSRCKDLRTYGYKKYYYPVARPDFQEVEPTSKGMCANHLLCKTKMPKTAWKRKNLDWEGTSVHGVPFDPPLLSRKTSHLWSAWSSPIHPAQEKIRSDWFVNSFTMVVYEKTSLVVPWKENFDWTFYIINYLRTKVCQ